MRTKFLILAAVGALLLTLTSGWAQQFGGRGGQGGMPGAGQGGRRGGGNRANVGDPNEAFNRLSNGKDVAVRTEITDPMMQAMFDRLAQRLGVTNGQITREQFVTSMMQRMAGGRNGGPPGAVPTGGGPRGRGAGGVGNNPDAWMEQVFRRYDQNGDGILNNDEMPEALRAERDKWDTNKDGFIDLNEFKVYLQARMQQNMADRAAAGGAPSDLGNAVLDPASLLPPEEEQKPVVYRAGHVPKELPPWFTQMDTDKDAQVGLYEWLAAGRPLEEFRRMDRNDDGFLTIEEVLKFYGPSKSGDSTPTNAVAQNGAMSNAALPLRGTNQGNPGRGARNGGRQAMGGNRRGSQP